MPKNLLLPPNCELSLNEFDFSNLLAFLASNREKLYHQDLATYGCNENAMVYFHVMCQRVTQTNYAASSKGLSGYISGYLYKEFVHKLMARYHQDNLYSKLPSPPYISPNFQISREIFNNLPQDQKSIQAMFTNPNDTRSSFFRQGSSSNLVNSQVKNQTSFEIVANAYKVAIKIIPEQHESLFGSPGGMGHPSTYGRTFVSCEFDSHENFKLNILGDKSIVQNINNPNKIVLPICFEYLKPLNFLGLAMTFIAVGDVIRTSSGQYFLINVFFNGHYLPNFYRYF